MQGMKLPRLHARSEPMLDVRREALTGSAPAPVAPDTDDDVHIDLDELWGDSDDDRHAECCAKEAFLCGAPYHPEAVARSSSDDACDDCIEMAIKGACPPPPRRPAHFHCPLVERESGLLTFCHGPKRGSSCR